MSKKQPKENNETYFAITVDNTGRSTRVQELNTKQKEMMDKKLPQRKPHAAMTGEEMLNKLAAKAADKPWP